MPVVQDPEHGQGHLQLALKEIFAILFHVGYAAFPSNLQSVEQITSREGESLQRYTNVAALSRG